MLNSNRGMPLSNSFRKLFSKKKRGSDSKSVCSKSVCSKKGSKCKTSYRETDIDGKTVKITKTPFKSLTSTPTSNSGSGTNVGCSVAVIAKEGSVEDQEYFHGILPRDEIICLLQKNGDFILRETQKGGESQIVISVFWDSPRHFIIQSEVEGFRLEGPYFQSVPGLVHYYYTEKVPLTSKTNAILIRPIKKEKWELDNKSITIGKLLGKGNFGEVYEGVFTDPQHPELPGLPVAVKTCKETMPEEEKRKFLKEARIMRKFNHPNIVIVIGVCAARDPMLIVMELAPGGCLVAHLKTRRTQNIPYNQDMLEKTKFCCDAASGMEYLSSQKCLHRDLAARNCLLDKNKVLKISDFGMSREGSIYTITSAKQMPIKWCAPEVLKQGTYTLKADVWSYGILMWEIFMNAANPYPALDNKQALEYIKSNGTMSVPEKIPKQMGDIMKSTWEQDPNIRPNFTDIKIRVIEVLNSLPKT